MTQYSIMYDTHITPQLVKTTAVSTARSTLRRPTTTAYLRRCPALQPAPDPAARDMSSLALGDRVLLADGRDGVVRFIGAPQFALGEWIGLELFDACALQACHQSLTQS